MSLYPLYPQTFESDQLTQLPAFDMYQFAKSQLPLVYQNANNFMKVILSISNQKQYLYDVIRSLVNVFNLNNTAGGPDSPGQAAPRGIYLKILASVFSAPWTDSPLTTDLSIETSIKNTIIFVNSRGRTSDFYAYFAVNGLDNSFTNNSVEEDGNATIFFNVPISGDPSVPPNPIDIFTNAMNKLKAAGISIGITPLTIAFFQLGSLPTDPLPWTAPGNAGFGGLDPAGFVSGGGFFTSL